MTDRALGRRHPDPARAARTLKVGDYLRYTNRNLTPPAQVDHLSRVTDWGLYRNDTFGICGPTAAANLRKLITAYLARAENSPTQDAVDALYALQNPGFNPATSQPGGPQDQGVDLQTMCQDLLSAGLGGVKALAFASVDVHNQLEVRECLTLFGGLILGVNLEVDQQAQSDARQPWNYVPGSAEWGGHAIMAGAYQSGPNLDWVISWAEQFALTDTFDEHQLEEAFVIIWPENMQLKGFVDSLDVAQLAADYEQLTGRKFPMTTPPDPTPTPAPVTPSPVSNVVSEIEAIVEREVAAAKAEAESAKGEILSRGRQLVSDFDNWLKEHGA
jgi:hypothetical protein